MTFDPTQNRATLSPEAVAQLVADREAGTPGPWREAQTWRPPIGNGPHNDMVNGNIFWGYSISGSDENGGHIYPTLAAVHNFPDHVHANARRIARLPDLEAAYLTLAAENATLRHNNDIRRQNMRDSWEAMQAMRGAINEHLPLPSIESDLMQGPENSVFCEVVATAVIGALSTLRASEAAALERVKVLEAGLADPVSVHANMLRGAIAMPSFANIKHLYAAEFAALTPTADKEPKT